MKKIRFNSALDVLPTDLVKKVLDKVNNGPMPLEKGACHQNSAVIGYALQLEGYEAYFCTGYFWHKTPACAHSFNRIVVDGKSYYVDFTQEFCGNSNDLNYFPTWSAAEYTMDYIWDIFEGEGQSFSPIVGVYDDMGNCHSYSGNVNVGYREE